jgi:hypothetical protein
LINKFGNEFPILGLKVTSIYPNDVNKHGNHQNPLEENFEIIEETDLNGIKDTSKMLLAGAKKVYYIRSKDNHIKEAINEFLKTFYHSEFIVCESISIRKYVNPGLFIMLKYNFPHEIKQSAIELEKYSDYLLIRKGEEGLSPKLDIYPNENAWKAKINNEIT